MRVATYNIWNHDTLFEERIELICEAVKESNSDIVCFQEVRSEEMRNVVEFISNKLEYKHFLFCEYPDSPDEGLAIISRLPFKDTSAIWETDIEVSNYCAIRVKVDYEGSSIGITNTHLNWRSDEIRNNQLDAVSSWISSKNETKSIEILCGDFNAIPQSINHQFLTERSWIDVVDEFEKEDTDKYSTFDLIDNHHLKDDVRAKEKLRFDWIMINNFDDDHGLTIDRVNLFGEDTSIYDILPSDHYGLYADLSLAIDTKNSRRRHQHR